MIYFIAPLIFSYVLFIFLGENFNPMKKPREVSARRRIRRARRIALGVLAVGYGLVAATQLSAG